MQTNLTPVTLTSDWLAHRYDPGHDAIHFVQADRAARVSAPFLTDECIKPRDPLVIRRSDVAAAGGGVRANFIFHSAYCCSTLLANAYDRPGRAFSLKEPVLLNDLVGWRHRGGDPQQIGQVLHDGLRLLARPFEPDEAAVIKPSNVVNGLAKAMIAARPEAGVLLLYAPLDLYLGSIAKKGLWGRLWVRDLLAKYLKEGLVDLGFGMDEIFLQTDLQVAAVGWLAQHRLFADITRAWPGRVRTLSSERLLARPLEALAACDALFGIADRDAERAAIVERVFKRHSKSGGAFSATERRADQRSATEMHGDELEKVVAWANAVADAAGITLDPPGPLLG